MTTSALRQLIPGERTRSNRSPRIQRSHARRNEFRKSQAINCRRWGPGMAGTLCQMIAPESCERATPGGARARLSTKGVTTARRKSAHPGAIRLGKLRGGGVLGRNSKSRQTEKDAKEQPKIGIQYKIFVRLDAVKCHGKEEKSGIPKDHECQWKPGRTSQLLHDSPCREQDRKAHDEPENQAADSHLKNERSEATLHADDRRFCVKDTRDVLSAEGSRADAVAVRPTVVTESAEEIPQRVIPGPDLEFARAAAGRKSLGVKRDARQQRLGENKKQQPET